MRHIDVPVLIVGAGPAGLTASLLLSRQGVGCHLVERRSGPQRAPAAHVVNGRTFEIFRQAGVDMAAIARAAVDPADGGSVYWVTKLGGEVIGRLPYERQGDDVLALTPTPLRNLSQHRLEPILVEAIGRAGDGGDSNVARCPGGGMPHYDCAWESAEVTADGVASRIRDLRSGERYEVRSRYLLAADGAGSPVRRWLGIQPIGPDRLQSFVMVHFAADLRRIVRDCPGVIYWICDLESGGTLVAHDIDREWVYMHAWDPDLESREDYTPERCEALVRRAIATSDVALEIRTVSTWTMTAQVAERYREGRVFLVGDSAHRFPPTGGLGLNTGVQDAHNLAWKIAAVLAGEAPPELLDTYERERRPIAQRNADQSLQNALRLFEVPEALGLDGDRAASTERMRGVLADPAARAKVAAAIANQAEHFDMFGLQLGIEYADGAFAADADHGGAAESQETATSSVRELVQTSRPGARLPHGWLSLGGHTVSSLDLVPPDRWTLVAGPEGDAWSRAAARVAPAMRRLQIGRDLEDPHGWWTRTCGLGAAGALLVRPDQHVALRARGAVADAEAALSAALATALRRTRAARA